MYKASDIKPGTAIYAKRDGVFVYANTSVDSEKIQYADEGSNNYRLFRKGDRIGTVPSTWNGSFGLFGGSQWLFVDVRYWRKRLFDWVRDDKLAYVRIEDDAFVTEADFGDLTKELEAEEKATVTTELLQYINGLPAEQRPYDWFKNSDGKWILKLSNGSTIGFEEYKKLSNTERAALSTKVPTNNLVNTGTGSGTGDEKSLFTTTNILLGVGILAALGIVLYLIFRKNGNRKR